MGIDKSFQFLESVCHQLIDRYDLPYTKLPAEATQDGRFLAQLLMETATKLAENEKLIIVVDALDEVTEHPDGPNILYLPPLLPEGVYFILTRRPMKLPLTVDTPFVSFDMQAHEVENTQDVRRYLQQALDNSIQLRSWIDNHPESLSARKFIETLSQLSENNFMYLRYVLPDIEQGAYRDLSIDQLPAGLQGYYDAHWRRMGVRAQPLPETEIKIVYILSELRAPASAHFIADLARVSVML